MKLQFEQQELQLMAQIIDVFCQKGIKAHDAGSIGALHQKVVAVLQAFGPEKPNQSNQPKEPYIKD